MTRIVSACRVEDEDRFIMVFKYTLRTLAASVSAIAVLLAALLNPTPRVAIVTANGVLVSVLVAACLAVGLRQPARSFCLGFAIACSGALILDTLCERKFIRPEVFTRSLATMVEEALPPIVHRGEPGTTRYFRSDGRFPIAYYTFGDDGTRTRSGLMELEHARRDGAFDSAESLQGLPHIDNVPVEYKRSQMLPYVLAAAIGLGGGLLSYAAHISSNRRADGPVRPTL